MAAAPDRGGPLFTGVRQVCTVVTDRDRVLWNLVEHLGIGPFKCWSFSHPRLFETTLRGGSEPWSMKLGIALLGGRQWEVIEPGDGATLYREHLDRGGPGVQHLLAATGGLGFTAAARTLAARGHPLVQTALLNPHVRALRAMRLPEASIRRLSLRIGYADGSDTLRTSIEVARYPLGLPDRFFLAAAIPDSRFPARGARGPHPPPPSARAGRLVKIGIVTRDVRRTAQHWHEVGGVAPWRFFDVDPDRREGMTVDGVPAGFTARVGHARLGDVLIEAVQPAGGDSPFQALLDARGEGVGWLGVSASGSYEALASHCRRLGYEQRMGGALAGDHPSAWFAARDFIGTDIEIVGPPRQTAASRAPAATTAWETPPPARAGTGGAASA
jgi:hypothetical protein